MSSLFFMGRKSWGSELFFWCIVCFCSIVGSFKLEKTVQKIFATSSCTRTRSPCLVSIALVFYWSGSSVYFCKGKNGPKNVLDWLECWYFKSIRKINILKLLDPIWLMKTLNCRIYIYCIAKIKYRSVQKIQKRKRSWP